MDLLKPNVAVKVHQKQTQQKAAHDQHAKYRSFDEGSSDFVYNFHGTPHWLPAIVIKQTGSVTFLVELEDKRQVRRHQDHIRYRASTDNTVIVDNQSSNVTGPAKTGHVGTNYTPSLYRSYLSTGKVYFHSITCIMMPMKCLL